MLVRHNNTIDLATEMVSKMPQDLFDSEVSTFVDPSIATGSYLEAVSNRLVLSGHNKYNIDGRLFAYGSSKMLQNLVKKRNNIEPTFIQEKFLETKMKFDVVIGNPPYGKNANLAIAFLNKASEISDTIAFVVPRTLKKHSSLKKISKNLHLQDQFDAADDAFDIGVLTCVQYWLVDDSVVRDVPTVSLTCEDFDFVSKEDADIALGRVGAGPCSNVYEEFEHRSKNSHYFLKVKDQSVVDRLKSLQPILRKSSTDTAGNPSLSKSELIRIYTEE